MDKDYLADLGILLANKFCVVNEIRLPTMNIYRSKDNKMAKAIKAVGTCGYYRSNNIHVAVPHCAYNNPNYSWPAFISDRTPYGVIQHELGHHVDEVMSGVNIYRHPPGNFFSDRIRQESGEKPITSYSPNTQEWFAEIFRLFVTNPLLLERIRPLAYAALIVHFKPAVSLHYVNVLDTFQAPSRIFERTNKWLNK